MKGLMGPNDYNLESNLARKGFSLEKKNKEVSSFIPFHFILDSHYIGLPIDQRDLSGY